jgi:hypothetical protein
MNGRWLLAVSGFTLVIMAIAGWSVRLVDIRRRR